MTKLDKVEDGCWVNLTYPTEDEMNTVTALLGIDPGFLRAALDEEETSRIDTEDGQTLIIIDLPSVEQGEAVVYSTLPPVSYTHLDVYKRQSTPGTASAPCSSWGSPPRWRCRPF